MILALPKHDAKGDYPVRQAAQVMLSRRVIADRKAARLTQAELAKRTGLRVETISRIENGKNMPDVATVDKIEAAITDARCS